MRYISALLAVGCVGGTSPEGKGPSWMVEVGLPDQRPSLADLADLPLLEGEGRDEWLARRPRVALDAGWASLAVPFAADPDPASVWLPGLYETGDQAIGLWTDPDSQRSGLDHNVSWTVRFASDAGAVDRWIGAQIDGDPGCGGARVPRDIRVFDTDREPLDYDGDTVSIGGVRVAVAVPEQICAVAE